MPPSELISDATNLRMLKALGAKCIRHDNGELWAIFDNSFQAALEDGSIESRGPALTGRTMDLTQVRKGAAITFKVHGVESTYRVLRHEPIDDGELTVTYLSA